MKIGKFDIELGKPAFIIAEAGINHNGNIEIAKEMIEEASRCGANAIKFQTIFPEELFSENDNPDLYSLIRKWSLNKKQHIELKKTAEKNNLEFVSTPVGKKSARLLQEIGTKCIKIASGELTNHELIQLVARTKKPMIISTGMSSIQEIASAITIPQNLNCPYSLLHCISSYPTSIEDANMKTIKYFIDLFRVPIGYSDHTIGTLACSIAVSLGACILEKHFTLDKKMEGPDQKLSADPKEFSKIVNNCRIIEKSLGRPRNGPIKSETKSRILMRKSLAASTNIKSNTYLKKSMVTTLRPGTGISPLMIDKIIGMKIRNSVKKGTLLTWKMF